MPVTLYRLAALFLKLGFTAFGGPAAHIAMFEAEVVSRRGWIEHQRFLDLVGATNLIPGPNSTEMCIHIGYILKGWRGMVVAGACFILPAAGLTLSLAWLYAQYGTVPEAADLLRGVKPAILVIIALALARLGKKAVKSADLGVLAFLVAVLALLGAGQVSLILAAGVVGMCWLRWRARLLSAGGLGIALLAALSLPASEGEKSVPGLLDLGLYFLKIGSVLFGSGYVLVAYLEEGLVRDYGWITQNQLLDAIAIGQLTPGPVLTTATFVGFLVAGFQGAGVATAAIFLPSFVFVAALNPLVPRLRDNRWTAAFLDSVNAAAVALMAAVLLQLARTALADWRDGAVLVLAGFLLAKWNVPSHWTVPVCAAAGWLLARIVAV